MARSTKERVIAAAADLFAQRGFRGTSTKDIARRARVNEATLFRNFGDKQALVRHVITDEINRAASVDIPAALRIPDFRDAMRAVIRCIRQLMQERFIRLQLALAVEQRGGARDFVFAMAPIYRAVASRIAAEQRTGTVRSDIRPIVAARMLIFTMFSHRMALAVLDAGTVLEIRDADRKAYLDLWLIGLRASGHTHRK